MKKIKNIGKYGIKGLRKNETLYFPIEDHGRIRCLCSYYKRMNDLNYSVNICIDDNGKKCVGVSWKKK